MNVSLRSLSLVSIFSVLMVLSAVAAANSGVTATIKTENSTETYKQLNNMCFELVSANSKTQTTFSGTGDFEGVKENTESKTDLRQNDNFSGSQKVCILSQDYVAKTASLTIESQLKDKMGNDIVNLPKLRLVANIALAAPDHTVLELNKESEDLIFQETSRGVVSQVVLMFNNLLGAQISKKDITINHVTSPTRIILKSSKMFIKTKSSVVTFAMQLPN